MKAFSNLLRNPGSGNPQKKTVYPTHLTFLFFLLLFFGFQSGIYGQETSAIVEFASPDKGFLIPRMTTESRTSIPFPAEGLVVYDMTLHGFYYFDGSVWRNTSSGTSVSATGDFWSLNGNATAALTPVIGTTDYNPLVVITNNLERFRITEDGVWLFSGGMMNLGSNSLMAKDLTVKENVFLNVNQGTTYIEGTTLINGESTIGGPAANQSTFTGDVNMNKDLDVDGTTQLNNTLEVTGETTINNSLDVLETTNTKDLIAKRNVLLNAENGTTTINGLLEIGGATKNPANFTGPVLIENKLTVDDIDLKNDLKVGGHLTVFKSTLLKDSLTVNGVTTITNKLNVSKAVDFDETLNVDGATTLKNTLVVDNSTTLNDLLTVKKDALLKEKLTVESTSNLIGNATVDGTLTVKSDVSFLKKLNVTQFTRLYQGLQVSGGTTSLDGALNVLGATHLSQTLLVDGLTTINNQLNVTGSVADGGFIATFSNTENTNGDGINIKLGKAKAVVYPTSFPTKISTQTVAQMKGLFNNARTAAQKNQDVIDIISAFIVEDAKSIAELTVGVGNLLITFFNTALHFPVDFPALAVPITFLPGDDFSIPIFPGLRLIPTIPEIDLSTFGVQKADILSREFWGIPSFNFNDSGNPLSKQNDFIRFSDVSNNQLGSIHAQSISDWEDDYLNPVFMTSIYFALTSSKLDKYHAQSHAWGLGSDAANAYNSIGVIYNSANGDYAEWLERINLNEFINPGDIVGVVGGKISKDLSMAEQVMVVSHNPIVLGNSPEDDKKNLGNNIAFMGQVPVKVMGPVASGDYIIGNKLTPGYGVAKNPDVMTVEDFKYAVGRSWEKIDRTGPFLVNTVVGIHNGDYLKILKNYEQKFKETEKRFDSLESKVNSLMETKETMLKAPVLNK